MSYCEVADDPMLFWDLTPHELGLQMEAYYRRQRREMTAIAAHATWVINSQRARGSRAVRIRDLIGEDKTRQTRDIRSFASLDDLNAAVDAHNAGVSRA